MSSILDGHHFQVEQRKAWLPGQRLRGKGKL